jgi:hypothetical protein
VSGRVKFVECHDQGFALNMLKQNYSLRFRRCGKLLPGGAITIVRTEVRISNTISIGLRESALYLLRRPVMK